MNTSTDRPPVRFERLLLYVMSGIYITAGVMHFVTPRTFARIAPPRFPRPTLLVYLSGVAEIVLGIGVLFRRTRRRSAWGLIALLLAVFPANVHMATSDTVPESVPDWATTVARVGLWARLPFQGVLMLWAWWYTRVMPENGA
nr:DoxX family membrane protein [Halalkalicoccus jeotgali]